MTILYSECYERVQYNGSNGEYCELNITYSEDYEDEWLEIIGDSS